MQVQNKFTTYLRKLLKYLAMFFVVATILFYLVSLLRNFIKLNSTGSFIESAQEKLELEKSKQKSLLEKLDVLSSEEYKKQMAKEKLGYVEEGEIVIILPDEDTLKKLSPRKEVIQKHDLPSANWEKWVKVFFDI